METEGFKVTYEKNLATYAIERPLTDHFVQRANVLELPNIRELAASEIGADLASTDVIAKVQRHNPDSVWGLYLSEDGVEPTAIGVFAFLMVNDAGLYELEQGTLNVISPDLNLLAPGGTKPAAMYAWAVVARGLMATALPVISEKLGRERYLDIDIYALASTEMAAKALAKFGFYPVGGGDYVTPGDLIVHRRTPDDSHAPS